MSTYIIEPDLIRCNFSSFAVLLYLIFAILIAISNISFLFIAIIEITFGTITIYFEKNTKVISIGIPIAKVIWTKAWEDECIRINSQLPQRVSYLTFQISNYADSWYELHAKYLKNTNTALYNYNTIEPVRGDPLNPKLRS